MTAFWIVALFVLQLGGFYMIALLYMRISKLDKTEKRQQQLMKEMEDSLALYISDIKDENDRLIDQLSKIRHQQHNGENSGEAKTELLQKKSEDETISPAMYFNPKPPTSKVLNSYRSQQLENKTNSAGAKSDKQAEETEFETIYRLSSEGLTPNEIASRLGKGKTEVELVLKFKG